MTNLLYTVATIPYPVLRDAIRDGPGRVFVGGVILFVVDYDSTLVGVITVFVVVVVALFHDGITRERFELAS